MLVLCTLVAANSLLVATATAAGTPGPPPVPAGCLANPFATSFCTGKTGHFETGIGWVKEAIFCGPAGHIFAVRQCGPGLQRAHS